MKKTNEVLWKEYKVEGCEASLVELIQQNEGLIISRANEWKGTYGAKGIEFEDLCSAGKEGFLRAVHTYDPSKGTLLSTHATNLINSHMQRYVMQNARQITYPEEVLRTINRINKCRPEGDAPNILDWYECFVETYKSTIPFKKFESLVLVEVQMANCRSLNEMLGESQKDELQDILGITESPEEEYMDIMLKEEMIECLDVLNNQERDAISMYFGLNGNTEMKQEQIAEKMGISKARVSAIMKKALYRLENSSRVKRLWEEM